MKRFVVIAGMVSAVVVAGCKDSTEPETGAPYVAAITQIHVPQQVALFDTVKLDFSYFTLGCDSSAVKIQQGETQLRFTAIGYPTERFCVNDFGGLHRFAYFVFPPHGTPLSVIFSEPSGGDSVRTVTPSL